MKHRVPRTRGIPRLRRRLAPMASPWWRRVRWLWARVRPAMAAVTPIGLGVVILGIVAWLLAWQLGWLEMAVVAAACLVLLAVAALFTIGRTRIEVASLVEPPRVTVGDPLTGTMTVRNKALAPVVSLALEFPIGDGGITYDVPPLLPNAEHAEVFVVPTQRRGIVPVGPVTSVRGDPLRLFRRTQHWTEQTEVFVHPETVALEPFGVGLIRDLEGTTAQNVSMSDLSFHAVREYEPGDDLRHIHWRATARHGDPRHGKLLVRQFLDTRRSHLVVIVDSNPVAYQSEDDYEVAISVAASMLRRGQLDEYDVTFLSETVVTYHGRGKAALDGCARATPQERSLIEVARRGEQIASDASLLVLVTGAHADYVTLQRAASQFSVDVARLAVRVDSTQAPSLRKAGELGLVSVGALTDLPLVLRWGFA